MHTAGRLDPEGFGRPWTAGPSKPAITLNPMASFATAMSTPRKPLTPVENDAEPDVLGWFASPRGSGPRLEIGPAERKKLGWASFWSREAESHAGRPRSASAPSDRRAGASVMPAHIGQPLVRLEAQRPAELHSRSWSTTE